MEFKYQCLISWDSRVKVQEEEEEEEEEEDIW